MNVVAEKPVRRAKVLQTCAVCGEQRPCLTSWGVPGEGISWESRDDDPRTRRTCPECSRWLFDVLVRVQRVVAAVRARTPNNPKVAGLERLLCDEAWKGRREELDRWWARLRLGEGP